MCVIKNKSITQSLKVYILSHCVGGGGFLGVDINRLVLPVMGYLVESEREILATLERLLSKLPAGILSRLEIWAPPWREPTFELARLNADEEWDCD